MLVVFGLMYLKRAQDRGVSTWTSMIVVCWSTALVFPAMTFMGTNAPTLSLMWQPAIMGALFLTGQLFMFLAVDRGDVSVAAPVLGVKVLLVPAIAPLFVDDEISSRIWVAAAIAVAGIGFVQVRDQSVERSRILAAVSYALLGAASMTVFDLLIARWASTWGAGFFLPIGFAFAAVFSLAFAPLANRPRELRDMKLLRPLAIAAVLMALQAIGMTVALGRFGDPTRVNIVYSLRGLWGVLLTWLLASRISSSASTPTNRTMTMRLVGAVLIGISVVISVT